MSDRKLAQNVQHLIRAVWKLYRRLTKSIVTWLLRTALLSNRRRTANAGFVLPTTVFLILVVALSAGALSYRAFSNSTQTIGEVQSKIIYNAATPAIDRARTKLDYLFGKDSRFPSGVPGEDFLVGMMLNGSRPIRGVSVSPLAEAIAGTISAADPYTLADETRIDVNGGGLDNAWVYKDPNTGSNVVYSITLSTPNTGVGTLGLLQLSDLQKSQGDAEAGPFVRNGPLSGSEAVTCRVSGGGSTIEGGWYQDATNTSILRKRFQVDAFVVRDADVQAGKPPTFTTLEFAQDRKLDRGNKWGAWFKNDLEIHPGARMNWNGAMHSEGNIIIGNDKFKAFLISSQNSCLFLPESNSEISVRKFSVANNGGIPFQGIVAAGILRDNAYGGNNEIYRQENKTFDALNLDPGTHWATGSKPLSGIAVEPIKLLTEDVIQARDPAPDNSGALNENKNFGKRVKADQASTQPYLDDTYRADNRYGPKVRYKNQTIPAGGKVGDNIPAGNSDLLRTPPDSDNQGFDGYWERRVVNDVRDYEGGMRILVGQRLELGNSAGWVAPKDRPNAAQDITLAPVAGNGSVDDLRTSAYGPANGTNADPYTSDNEGDPLYPPHKFANRDRAHEARQRRALRDNAAAVQSAAIYHYKVGGGKTPAACLAVTAHPGSPYTLRKSVNFKPTVLNGGAVQLSSNFFYGDGTNGWEYAPPNSFTGGSMGIALQNLANFAGDYTSGAISGAYPPTQEAGRIHPDPFLTMWGDFSNLKRALVAGNGSAADQSYLHTAGCTLGMLADNIEKIQTYDPALNRQAAGTGGTQTELADLIGDAMDGFIDSAAPNPAATEVLPASQLATYGYGTTAFDASKYNPRDYDLVTPEMLLGTLKQSLALTTTAPEDDPRYKLAKVLHLHFQIRRDRTYGFRPSPAANTWNYNPFVTTYTYPGATPKPALWSSACDPNLFSVAGAVPTGSAGASLNLGPLGNPAKRRLYLSRLCGAVTPPGGVHDLPGDNQYPSRGATGGLETGVTLRVNPALVNTPSDNLDAAPKTAFTPALDVGGPANSQRALVMPEFPSLYYIFPAYAHTHVGGVETASGVDHQQPGNAALDPLPAAFQPWKEPYITNPSANTTFQYQPVNSTAAAYARPVESEVYGAPVAPSFNARDTSDFAYRAFQPFPDADKSVDLGVAPRAADLSNWVLPTIPTVAATAANPNRIVRPDGALAAVPFQDRVLFNGREWLPSRVLDIDLDMLRRSGIGGDAWLPASGLVYAFREDATREDAIARPAAGTFTNAQVAGSETDPAINATYGVSVKPVDYIADPDRKIHGFRLRNGEVLKREVGLPDNRNGKGLSFITDNLAYIMGDFNKHQGTPGGTRLEEFKELLPDDPFAYNDATFYNGRTTRDDTDFAKPANDLWRPSEILADTATILSRTFCDGSAIDSFMVAGYTPNNNWIQNLITDTTVSGSTATSQIYQQLPSGSGGNGAGVYNDTANGLYAPGCQDGQATSFLNQNLPARRLTNASGWNWVRENPNDPIFSPVKVSRNGNGLISVTPAPTPPNPKPTVPVEYSDPTNDTVIQGAYNTVDFNGDDRSRPLQRASETTVNTIMVSGIVPSRASQGYGGLHNFPRFLEWWGGPSQFPAESDAVSLRFAGSFLQLSFSNYATGPYDIDTWEPSAGGTNIDPKAPQEMIDYYGYAPKRVWGYDVALQKVPASPAAARFTTPSSQRSEFYDEPKANDPYMSQLCTALRTNPPAGANLTNLNCPT
jgi:hypothetical protein